MYCVETIEINQAVRNNRDKFTTSYMFELNNSELYDLRSKKMITSIVMPDLQTSETESSLEINFFFGKLKHTVKRVRKEK